MRTLIDSRIFNRLKKLDEIFQKKLIPLEFKLKYSKTEGYIIVVHGDAKSDFATIAIWPLFKDFNVLAEMIDREMKEE